MFDCDTEEAVNAVNLVTNYDMDIGRSRESATFWLVGLV